MKLLFFFTVFLWVGILFSQKEGLYCAEINEKLQREGTFPFGIASGDPSDEGMVLLTQINPFKVFGLTTVECQLSEGETFTEIYRKFQTTIRIENAYSAKITAYGLAEGKTYYYRFIYGEDTSMVGRTRTLPKNPKNLRFAVVSCSNYEWGWFNAYEALSKSKDLDFVIHLGDYIYEHGPGTYGDKKLARKHVPSKEIVSLVDYRSRYAQYRMDPQLQALHKSVPFISVWDDHEIASESEGGWQTFSASPIAYKDFPKLSTLLREISWSHNLAIFSRCKTIEEREFYLKLAKQDNYSFRELDRQISASLFERTMIGNSKLSAALRVFVNSIILRIRKISSTFVSNKVLTLRSLVFWEKHLMKEKKT